MGRKHHDKLVGMTELGTRLRQLREKAGLSQMQLAASMGFAPTHGYKYVFRLEKGQVPNPTLRTLASYLDACAAGWEQIVDLLPRSRPAKRQAAPTQSESPESDQRRACRPGSGTSEQAPTRPRDTRPLRLKVRYELLSRRQAHAREFWTRFERVEKEVAALLAGQGVVSNQQRRYFAFVRSCCTVVDAYARSRPGLVGQELAKCTKAASEAGLDEKLLSTLTDLCLKHMLSAGGTGT